MPVVLLIAILLGSFSTALAVGLSGASWGMIALGYVAGGWIGLATAGLALALACRLSRVGQDGRGALLPRSDYRR